MATRVNSSYVAIDDLAATLGITDTIDNDRLTSAIAAASRTVDAICRRQTVGGARGGFWYVAAATATFRPEPGYNAVIGDWAAVGTASISVDGGVTWTDMTAGTGYQLEPLNADLLGEVYTELRRFDADWPQSSYLPGRPCLRIVGTLGWATVPSEVSEAAAQLALKWFKRKDTPLGYGGSEMGAVYVRRGDSDVESLLSRLVYHGPAVSP